MGRYIANPRAEAPRGTMETLSSGSACSSIQPITAWPASWYATVLQGHTDIAGCVMIAHQILPAMA